MGHAGKAAALGALGFLGIAIVTAILLSMMDAEIVVEAAGLLLVLVTGALVGVTVWAIHEWALHEEDAVAAHDHSRGGTRLARPVRLPPEGSIDAIVYESEQAFRDGQITRQEFDRRVRKAYGYED